MKIIAGLGNPGDKFLTTRHNVGFLAIDFILQDDKLITARPSKEFKSEVYTWLDQGKAGGQNADEKIVFLKPQTYMNDSGLALKVISNFYKLDLTKDLLVIHDDTDFPLGTIRSTESASAAGHKGVQSIINDLGTQDFHRIRIGVETRQSRADLPTDAFVLQDFTKDELEKIVKDILPKVKKEVEKFLRTN